MERVILVNCKKCQRPQQTIVRNMQRREGNVKCVYCNKLINKKEQFIRIVR